MHAGNPLPAVWRSLHRAHAAFLESIADGLRVQTYVIALAIVIGAALLHHMPLIAVAHHLYVLIQRVNSLVLAWLVALEDIILLRRYLFEAFSLLPLLLLLLIHLQRQIFLTALVLSIVTIL